ncbi:MAG TPA: hypothetical protein VIX83_02065 [Candidatus Cybelea sp.]
MKIAPLSPIVLAAVMTACSSNAPSVPSAAPAARTASQAARADTTACPKSVLYVSSAQNGTVEIYDRTNLKSDPCGSVTGLQAPQGLFVDSKGNLWVADSATRRVYVFAPGSPGAIKTLNDPDGQPAAIAVDEKSNTAYVTEHVNNMDATNLVQVYANGSTIPTAALRDPSARNGGFAAVDDRGNLYVTFMTQSNTAQVDEWLGGRGAPKNLGLKLVSAGAIVTTKNGTLAACDPFAYRCGEFARGAKRMSHVFGHIGLGVPPEMKRDKRDWLFPDALAIDGAEDRAYVAAETLSGWKYPGPANRPSHKPFVEVRVPGLAGNGIAVYPASPPGRPY